MTDENEPPCDEFISFNNLSQDDTIIIHCNKKFHNGKGKHSKNFTEEEFEDKFGFDGTDSSVTHPTGEYDISISWKAVKRRNKR